MIRYDELFTATSKKIPNSNAILERASHTLLSSFVTGPYRFPANVVFVDHGKGSKVWDVDGNEYLDMTMGYGPLILGHAPDVTIEAAHKALAKGTTYAIASEPEVEMAELMCEAIPCAERVTFCNSGTEATMQAIKIARATTGRNKIASFEGGYHGVHDVALIGSPISSGSGPMNSPASTTDCDGIPDNVADNVLKLAFDCDESLARIRLHKDELAAVIIEPVPSGYPVNMQNFLTKLRAVTRDCGVLLIFDEVITGFRCGYGGGQTKYGITPDIATYGKVMGGGFPAGAVAGSVEAMRSYISSGDIAQDSHDRKVFSVGTFSGNPITMSVGAAVLRHLRDNPEIYTRMDHLTAQAKGELNQWAKQNGIAAEMIGENSWFMPYMGDVPFSHYRDGKDPAHTMRNVVYSNYMRHLGVYIPDLHTIFFSDAHTQADAERFVNTSKRVLTSMQDQGMFGPGVDHALDATGTS
ncbi:MAG: aspartate aminotransferase family protein [Gammaproteobacteria bacterium]|nr:aspartate aminotransferase family protein [Gammaproteobacteria bacterium]